MEKPPYICITNTASRSEAPDHCCLRKIGRNYYRDAGNWWVDVNIVRENMTAPEKLKIYIKDKKSPLYHLNGVEVFPCTEEEWRESNGRHAPDKEVSND